MYRIVIFDYNNYGNRIVKEPQLYLNKYGTPLYTESAANFTEGDLITSTIIAGRQNNSYDGTGNYMVVTDNDDDTVLSRWFIVGKTYTRGGQWKINLKRDTIADNWDAFLTSIANIRRGYVGADNKLIYNNENFNLNQIKKSEDLLTDTTGVPWIVGYYTENTDNFPLTATVTNINIPTITYSGTLDQFKTKYSKFTEKVVLSQYVDDTNLEYSENMDYVFNYYTTVHHVIDKVNLASLSVSSTSTIFSDTLLTGYAYKNLSYNKLEQPTLLTKTNELMSNSMDRNNLNYYNNKYVKFSDGTIKYLKYKYEYKEIVRELTTSDSLYSYLLESVQDQFKGTPTLKLGIKYHQGTYTLEVLDTALGTYNVSIDSGKAQLVDAPYKMFCIPYGDIPITVGTKTLTLNKDIALLVAQALNTKYGETFIKDLQLLPYCPCQYYVQADGSLIVPNLTNNYSEIKNGDTTIGFILHCYNSSFTFNIMKELTVTNVKVENETDMYRLSSPNGNGVFEFNLAKNGGLNFINVDCTYMPFNPFIHLSPNFKNLYGADFNDYRGLICGGDFSLPKTTSAWETYQLNNKNYQAIFDRGITNLEVNQSVERMNDIAGIFTGGLSGASSGAITGSLIGMPITAGIGAVVGTAAGGIDLYQNEKLRKETKAYSKDMYTLQNGNIKAQAQGIAKTIAFNINNKVFPTLEFYTCTDDERALLKTYLTYKSFTLNTIGTIGDYYSSEYPYVEGTIIRSTISDATIMNDINNELNGGIYIYGK